jgi:hypothetical protein
MKDERKTLLAMWTAYREMVLAQLPRPFSDIEWTILETTFYAGAQSTLRALVADRTLFALLYSEAESHGKRIQQRLT